MEAGELFSILETLQLMRFAELEEGDVKLTEAGQHCAGAEVDARKRLFAEHLLAYVPLAALIRRVLDERPSHRAPFTRFSEELEDYMSEENAEHTVRAVISWGRYAETLRLRRRVAAIQSGEPELTAAPAVSMRRPGTQPGDTGATFRSACVRSTLSHHGRDIAAVDGDNRAGAGARLGEMHESVGDVLAATSRWTRFPRM